MARIQPVRTGRDDRQQTAKSGTGERRTYRFWVGRVEKRKPRRGEPAGLGSLAGPNEGVTLVRFHQAAEDRCCEARIVELDRDVGVARLALGRPGCSDLRLAGEDPEAR